MSVLRRFLAATVCMMAPLATCLAQTPVTFATITSKSGATPTNIYAIDVNNDGIPDVVQDSAQNPNGFTVSISEGNGSFKAPVFYSVASTGQTPTPMAFGDFNGDGKVDIAVSLTESNTIAVYLGNGDGTFQSPKNSTVALLSGQTLAFSPIVTADFNHDGNLDLVVVAASGETSTVYVLPGEGTGGFGAPQAIFTPPSAPNPTGSAVLNMATGDFDADNNADIALTATTENSIGGYASTTVHVLYGDGDFGFTDTVPYSEDPGELTIASGDLNSDGRTDLFGLDLQNGRLDVFYGQTNRTFTSYFNTLPNSYLENARLGADPSGFSPILAMADFNDDGQMDLVSFGQTVTGGTDQYLLFFLAGSDPGQFTLQQVNLPAYLSDTNPVVGDFNSDTKPDVALVQSNEIYSAPNNTPSYITVDLNGTSNGVWSNCPYPVTGEGISLCAPTSSPIPVTSVTTPVSFAATANSYGQIRKIELWVDGAKIEEQHNTWGHNAYFGSIVDFASGTHSGTLYEADIDNTLQRLNFNFTVGASSCSAPTSDGLHVCSPASGATSSSPVLVQATSKVPGTVLRMEVWVDGVKKNTNTSGTNFLSAYISLGAGTHLFTFYAVNTEGTEWSDSVTATVP